MVAYGERLPGRQSGEAWLCRGDAMRRRAQSPRRVAPSVSHATTGEVVVARLKLLTLSASGGGQAHAVRRAADGLVEGEELAASHASPTLLQERWD